MKPLTNVTIHIPTPSLRGACDEAIQGLWRSRRSTHRFDPFALLASRRKAVKPGLLRSARNDERTGRSLEVEGGLNGYLMNHIPRICLAVALVLTAGYATAGCGAQNAANQVVLMTHESFNVPKDVLKKFENETGLKIKLLAAGDTGQMLNQAILTKSSPSADVIYGVDNTFLARALDADLFVPYVAKDINSVPTQFRLDEKSRVTPVDYGDVCVNYDKTYFKEHNLTPPTSLPDLTNPKYKNLLTVEQPATSSPGLAFMLATIAASHTDANASATGAAQAQNQDWTAFWRQLRNNDVQVVTSWNIAYNNSFSAGATKGSHPLVVSYATSPIAQAIFSQPPPSEPQTGIVAGTCFRQVEFAGVVKGAKNSRGAKELVNFLLSQDFQQSIPLSMFVYPANADVELPKDFTKYASVIDAELQHGPVVNRPYELDYRQIGANRDRWIEEWDNVVLH